MTYAVQPLHHRCTLRSTYFVKNGFSRTIQQLGRSGTVQQTDQFILPFGSRSIRFFLQVNSRYSSVFAKRCKTLLHIFIPFLPTVFTRLRYPARLISQSSGHRSVATRRSVDCAPVIGMACWCPVPLPTRNYRTFVTVCQIL